MAAVSKTVDPLGDLSVQLRLLPLQYFQHGERDVVASIGVCEAPRAGSSPVVHPNTVTKHGGRSVAVSTRACDALRAGSNPVAHPLNNVD